MEDYIVGSIILQIGQYIYDIYYWLILIFIFGSWFPRFHSSKFGMMIARVVDPYLSVFRKFIPPLGMIDLSPIIALIAYRYLGGFALMGLRELLILIGL
nr:YggT family protein [Neobacillus sp. Marseille-Q6967]